MLLMYGVLLFRGVFLPFCCRYPFLYNRDTRTVMNRNRELALASIVPCSSSLCLFVSLLPRACLWAMRAKIGGARGIGGHSSEGRSSREGKP